MVGVECVLGGRREDLERENEPDLGIGEGFGNFEEGA